MILLFNWSFAVDFPKYSLGEIDDNENNKSLKRNSSVQLPS